MIRSLKSHRIIFMLETILTIIIIVLLLSIIGLCLPLILEGLAIVVLFVFLGFCVVGATLLGILRGVYLLIRSCFK